jgi:hypothetical protein
MNWETQITNGIKLTESSNLTHKSFGWKAVTSAMLQLCKYNIETYAKLKDSVLKSAYSENSYESLSLALNLYKTDVLERNRILAIDINDTSNSIQKTAFLIAVLSLFYDTGSNTINGSTITYKNDLQFIKEIFLADNGVALSKLNIDSINSILAGSKLESALLALALSKKKNVLSSISDNDTKKYNIISKLIHNTINKTTILNDALNPVINAASRVASTNLINENKDELSIDSILKDLNLYSIVIANDPVLDRSVIVNPKVFILYASYYPFPNCWRCDWGQRTWSSSVDSRQIVPITYNFNRLSFLNTGLPGNPSSWRSFEKSDYYVGATFSELTKSGLNDTGTNGVTAYGFGMMHKIWMPVLDPNNGATAWGPDPIRFSIRFGFTPSEESIFVAVRWKGYIKSVSPTIMCYSGSLYPGGDVATELANGWRVFCIIPGAKLEFGTEYEPEIQQQSTRTGYTLGYAAAQTKEDYIEFIEINSANAHLFKYSNPSFEDDPEILNNPSESENGLLTYAASITRVVNNPDWPEKIGNNPALATSAALAKLKILSIVSTLNLDALPGFAVINNQIPWKERQKLLKASLPLICFKIFQRYNPSLSLQNAILNNPLLKISQARSQVSFALETLANITSEQGNKALALASKAASGSPDPIEDMSLLATALFGAQEVLAQLESEFTLAKEIGCTILKSLQYKGITPVFPPRSPTFLTMRSDPEALSICE